MEGALVDNLAKRADAMAKSITKLRPEEAAVLALLQRRLAVVKSRRAADAKAEAAKPKTVREALQRSLKLVNTAHAKRRKAS